MNPRMRSALLLALVIGLLLAGYLLSKLETGDSAPSLPDSDLTPAATATPAASQTAGSTPVATTATPATARTPTPAPSSGAVRDLAADEARGGHTLARHVGKSDDDLATRLKSDRDISAASTYTDRDTAERAVGTALAKKASDVTKWEQKTGSRANLAVRVTLDSTVGRSWKRGAKSAVDVRSVVVVLRWDGDGWYVLTSYPEDR